MNPNLCLKGIETVYKFAKAGLLHCRKDCLFCGMPMSIMKTEHFAPLYLAWKCPLCWSYTCITRGTPLFMISTRGFDVCLKLFAHNARPIMGSKLCSAT